MTQEQPLPPQSGRHPLPIRGVMVSALLTALTLPALVQAHYPGPTQQPTPRPAGSHSRWRWAGDTPFQRTAAFPGHAYKTWCCGRRKQDRERYPSTPANSSRHRRWVRPAPA